MFDGMDWGSSTNDQIDEAFAHFFGLASAGLARVFELIQEVDARQSWMRDGARTLAEWVSARLALRSETASRLVRIARRLVDLPVVSERFAAGELSLDQVDALSRMATPETETGLIEETLGLSNSELDRRARRAHPPSADDERTVYDRRAAYLQWNLDESELRMRANMPAAEGQVVQNALEAAADRIPPNPETGMFDAYPQRLVDGLVEVCATTGDESAPPQVTLFADLEVLTTETEGVAELSSTNLIPNHTARRLCCDAAVQTVITDGSQIIGIGRNSRTIPPWLRRLVYHRDGGRCQFPGCRNTKWLQVHHRQHWADGGTTDLDNLILLCGYHHRFVHEHDWHITQSETGFVFRKPDWTIHPPPREPLHPRLKQLVRSP